MSIHQHVLALLLPWSLVACASSASLPAGERIGDDIAPVEIVPFAVVDANPSAYFERTLLVEATATAVCQPKGCWMQVEDEGRTALVRWEEGCGGRYSFPRDLAGRRILIQGSFYPKELSAEDARHLEEEAGRPLELPLDGYEFNASAVLVLAR